MADTVYRPLAAWVHDHTPADAVVHAADVGYQGYFSDWRILDAGGLVTTDVQDHYARTGRRPNGDPATT